MAYLNRRVRNIDNWLQKKGYYRKVLPRDGHCIFRAASEQMYMTQVFHGYVRAECANYAREFPDPFQQSSDKDWKIYLSRLQKGQVVCGQLEMRILSWRFKRDIVVFDSSNRIVTNITKRHFKKQIRLCYVEPDHYDLVLTLESTNNAGFCQSIVYKILYENVFGINNVEDVSKSMLSVTNDGCITTTYITNSKSKWTVNLLMKDTFQTTQPIFPYKVAKALDPNLYRNIDYDVWIQLRKDGSNLVGTKSADYFKLSVDYRINSWYFGGDDLKVGTKCLLQRDNDVVECYIQKIMEDTTRCNVYIISEARRQDIPRSRLKPLPNAEAWPVPYWLQKPKRCSVSSTGDSNCERMVDQYLPERDRNQEFWEALEQLHVEPMDTNADSALEQNYIESIQSGIPINTFGFADGEETQTQPVPIQCGTDGSITDTNQNCLPPVVFGYGATNVYNLEVVPQMNNNATSVLYMPVQENPEHQMPPAHENYVSCPFCLACPHNVSVIAGNMHQVHTPNMHLHTSNILPVHASNMQILPTPNMEPLHSPNIHPLYVPHMHQIHSSNMHQLQSPNMYHLHTSFSNGLSFMGHDYPTDVHMHNAIYSRISTPGVPFPFVNTFSQFPYGQPIFIPYAGDYYFGVEPDLSYSTTIYRERHTTLRLGTQNSSEGASNRVQNEVNNNLTRSNNFNIPTSQHSVPSSGASSTRNKKNNNKKKRNKKSN